MEAFVDEKLRLTVQRDRLTQAHDLLLQMLHDAQVSGEPRETLEQARSAVLRALECSAQELRLLRMRERRRN